MAITIKDVVVGRKAFFLAPDESIFPESYLEEYCALGYETYFIKNDKSIPFDKKVEIIIKLFPDSIIFFNVDSVISGVAWIPFIQQLQASKKNTSTIIGVYYAKKQNKDIKYAYERKFLYDIGIIGGCVQLEYQKNLNFGIMQKVLFANQAQGRRKNIRALCTKQYTYSFMKDGSTFNGVLQDISLSHFSLLSADYDLQIKVGEKIPEFQFYLNGLLIRTPVVLIMKRDVENAVLYVFAFFNENGSSGLSERYRQLLIPNIYQLKCNNLKRVFQTIIETDAFNQYDDEEIGNLKID